MCWGEKIAYPSGKLAFSYICPIEDIGLPKGYIATKAGKTAALKGLKKLEFDKNTKKLEKNEGYNSKIMRKTDNFNF